MNCFECGCWSFVRAKHFEDIKEFKDVLAAKGTAPGKWITNGKSHILNWELDSVIATYRTLL